MSLTQENKDIKFPASHYVGFQVRGHEDGVPLGFMTPDGTDQAAIKRKSTVDNWANSGRNTIPSKTFENKAMSGFKLGRNVRHGYGWGQGNVKWRIEDPRGFELEITSPNLAAIMECATIEKGEILEKCMWARLKGDNILVPVTSDVYKAAQENSERVSKTASLKDLKPGNKFVFQNGATGTYLGSFYTLSNKTDEDGMPSWGDKKRFFYTVEREVEDEDGKTVIKDSIDVVASAKLSSIDSSTEITEAEALDRVNKWLATDDNTLSDPGNGWNRTIYMVGTQKSVPVTVELEEVSYDQLITDSPKRQYYGPYPKFKSFTYLPNGKLVSFVATDHKKAMDSFAAHTAAYDAAKAAAFASGTTFWRSKPEMAEALLSVYDAKAFADEKVLKRVMSTDNYYRKLEPEQYRIRHSAIDPTTAKFYYARLRTTGSDGQEVDFLLPYR